jgi:phosphoserine aminotransferase
MSNHHNRTEGKTLSMSQPYDRIFNFSAGPCTLPVPVLEQVRDQLLNYCGSGMSVMEMSHRSAAYEAIIQAAAQDLRTLLDIPDNYRILFLQGGASLQFSMIPMSFLRGGSADYIVTGTWGKKALESASLEGDVKVAFDGRPGNYSDIGELSALDLSPDARYVHFTSNETIQGVEYSSDPTTERPLICDMSSDILSRAVDVSKYAMIYAGAQKNMGPAGVTVAIIRDDFLATAASGLPPMLDYKVADENDSMYNTPPTFAIYVCGLVYKHLLQNGGVAASQSRSRQKSQVLYDAIDGSGGFYKGHAANRARSVMNVTFTLPSDDLTSKFVKGATSLGLDGLKGHRSVGGVRASIYSAFPLEGCQALAAYMSEFSSSNG